MISHVWVLWWLFGFICDLLHRQIFVQQAICEQLQKEWNRSEVHLSVKIIIYLCTNWLNIYYFSICLSEKGVRICSFRVFLNCHERFLFYRLVLCHFSVTKYFCLPKKTTLLRRYNSHQDPNVFSQQLNQLRKWCATKCFIFIRKYLYFWRPFSAQVWRK